MKHPIPQGDRHRTYGLSDLKLQLIHNVLLDDELNSSQSQVAITLIIIFLDSQTGWCFRSDSDLANCAGISIDTLRRKVKPSSAFKKYFAVTSGKYKGRATEYKLTPYAMEDAAKRRCKGWSSVMRANGSSALEGAKTKLNKGSERVPSYDCEGGNSLRQRREKTPKKGGEKHLPITVSISSSNPDHASLVELDLDIDQISRRFTEIYPRSGNVKKIEEELRALLQAGVDPLAILMDAEKYVGENRQTDEQFLKRPENWLRRLVKEGAFESRASSEKLAQVNARWIDWITSKHPNARHCSPAVARDLISAGTVTEQQCRDAGISI